mmetsp:Transcript_22305/g.31398  ORF Transcript_22305/g.31398 Transcript_22305/m.31398 type:complete len:260 (+) Transcript_22305:125-904(+)
MKIILKTAAEYIMTASNIQINRGVMMSNIRKCFISKITSNAKYGVATSHDDATTLSPICTSTSTTRCLHNTSPQLFPAKSTTTSTTRRRRYVRNMGMPPPQHKKESNKEGRGGQRQSRKGNNDNQSNNSVHHTQIVTDSSLFQEITTKQMDKIEKALEPMKAYNEVFTILRKNDHDLTLRLKPSEGSYILESDVESCILTLKSPMSGNYTYVLREKSNDEGEIRKEGETFEFVGMDDGHLMEGMLVRDLIRHCNGLPHF